MGSSGLGPVRQIRPRLFGRTTPPNNVQPAAGKPNFAIFSALEFGTSAWQVCKSGISWSRKLRSGSSPYLNFRSCLNPNSSTLQNMRTLTNDYNDCELLNLGYNTNGHGPYVVRKDGTWVLNVTVLTLPEKEQEQFIFQNAAELYATVEDLGGKPVVEDALPVGKSRAELDAAIETTISKVWSRINEARTTRLTIPGI